MKKIVLGIVNVLSVAAIVIALFILCTAVLTKSGEAPNILGHYVFRVMTGSMQPTVPEDALIVVRKTELSEIEPEDIISYYSTDPLLDGSVNTHRVVAVEQQGESYIFRTKGDANTIEDHYPALGENVLGKVVFISYPLGVVVNFLSSPVAFVVLILLPILIIFVSNLIRTVRSARTILKEEQEAAVQAAVEALQRKKAENAEKAENTGNAEEFPNAEKTEEDPEAKKAEEGSTEDPIEE